MKKFKAATVAVVMLASFPAMAEPVFGTSEPRAPTPYRSSGLYDDCESCQASEKMERQRFDREYERYYDYQTYGRKIQE
ncbi:hypothetical protein [Methylocystis echinoides]|uniref:hypothetical protein n=1 Tax=Methylocystis echinoides TaxID=29468 RepID=UPI00343F02F1